VGAPVFPWFARVRATSDIETEPTAAVYRLGGDYELAVEDNGRRFRRRLTLELSKETPQEAVAVEHWVRSRGGAPFLVPEPDGDGLIAVRYRSMRKARDGRFRVLRVLVEEVRVP
jgi:hypothetical protein